MIHLKLGGVDIDFLRSGGRIDLSVLSREARQTFEREFRDDVLRLPLIMKKLGIPNVELPSANLFRRLFRYEVDTSRTGRSDASNDGCSQ